MKNFVRGSTIVLKFRFHDSQGEIWNPTAANYSVSYIPHGDYAEPTTATFALTQSGNDWLGGFDSSVAAPCVVSVHAVTADGIPTSAIDTQFRLTANRANRELVGDW